MKPGSKEWKDDQDRVAKIISNQIAKDISNQIAKDIRNGK